MFDFIRKWKLRREKKKLEKQYVEVSIAALISYLEKFKYENARDSDFVVAEIVEFIQGLNLQHIINNRNLVSDEKKRFIIEHLLTINQDMLHYQSIRLRELKSLVGADTPLTEPTALALGDFLSRIANNNACLKDTIDDLCEALLSKKLEDLNG